MFAFTKHNSKSRSFVNSAKSSDILKLKESAFVGGRTGHPLMTGLAVQSSSPSVEVSLGKTVNLKLLLMNQAGTLQSSPLPCDVGEWVNERQIG